MTLPPAGDLVPGRPPHPPGRPAPDGGARHPGGAATEGPIGAGAGQLLLPGGEQPGEGQGPHRAIR